MLILMGAIRIILRWQRCPLSSELIFCCLIAFWKGLLINIFQNVLKLFYAISGVIWLFGDGNTLILPCKRILSLRAISAPYAPH